MEKIKQFIDSDKGKDILTVIIILLVALGSFFLGRLSKKAQNQGIQIQYMNQQASAISANNTVLYNSNENNNTISSTNNSFIPAGKSYFASNRGQKYYPLSCSAGKSIKIENRIYFATKLDAEKAGYQMSASCK